MTNFLARLFRPAHGTAPAGPGRSDGPAWIEIDALHRLLVAGEPVVLIDVRQPDEYLGSPGHLPGAINIPLPTLATRVDEVGAHHGRPVVLVCKTDRRSAKAAETLLASGLKNVAILRGGTDGWHRLGLPLDL
jgi:rhodanese-related sulfurtransferase